MAVGWGVGTSAGGVGVSVGRGVSVGDGVSVGREVVVGAGVLVAGNGACVAGILVAVEASDVAVGWVAPQPATSSTMSKSDAMGTGRIALVASLSCQWK